MWRSERGYSDKLAWKQILKAPEFSRNNYFIVNEKKKINKKLSFILRTTQPFFGSIKKDNIQSTPSFNT